MIQLIQSFAQGHNHGLSDIFFPHYIEELSKGTAKPFMLDALSQHKAWQIRYMVGGESRTPADALTKLAGDENRFVRCAVAANDYTPQEILRALSKDKEEIVRFAVAAYYCTPHDVLQTLSKDKSRYVQLAASYKIEIIESNRRAVSLSLTQALHA